MDIKELLARCDHTLLAVTAEQSEIETLCDEAVKYGCASVCIPPSYVKKASAYLKGKGSSLAVCTVIGFPNGYNTTKVKVYETEQAVLDGASEIDMVINLGWVKDGKYYDVLNEIKAVKEACHGRILKVIIETCLLEDAEKITLCKIVTEAGAKFIKTSTGFQAGGATPSDVALLKANVGRGVEVKAAGGISTLDDADLFLKLGASRLGTSKVVKLFEKMENK